MIPIDKRPPYLFDGRDPQPFSIREGANLEWLVVCDHASNRIPNGLGDLGIPDEARQAHIAWDIGAEVAANRLAERLGAPLVAASYSRLVIDCNRYPDASDAIPSIIDGIAIPGNSSLSLADRAERRLRIAVPYHAAIAHRLDRALAVGKVPVLLSIHSCTPTMAGTHRPWHIGVAWLRDDRLALPVINALREICDFPIGDNLPYDLELGGDFTVPEHAMVRGLPHLQIEFRNDLVADRRGAEAYADLLYTALMHAMSCDTVRTACAQQIPHLLGDDPIRAGFAAGNWRTE